MRLAMIFAAYCAAVSAARAAPPAIMLTGRGVQIYTCSPGPGGFGWRLVGPDADLFDAHGALAGHHAAGPVWRARDGSAVTGEKLAEGAAAAPGAVPWLVLRAKAHAGAGVFANVGYITRTMTEGGAAPPDGCDAAHKGAEHHTPYNATYIFFPATP